MSGEAVWERVGQKTDCKMGESCTEPCWQVCIVNCWLFFNRDYNRARK